MSISEIKVNDQKIIPIKTNTIEDPNKIKGYDIIPKLYANIFICAKKGSGKTNVIWHILKNCASHDSYIYIFAATAYNDSNWEYILNELEKRQIGYEVHLDIDLLNEIIQSLREEEKEKHRKVQNTINDQNSQEIHIPSFLEKYIKIMQEKNSQQKSCNSSNRNKIAPKYFFIFDDMSEELKSSAIKTLIKQHRHYKTKVIISSQYPIDLEPGCRKQIDQWILFGGHNKEKLDLMREAMSLNITEKEFLQLYNYCTIGEKNKYNFLNIFTSNNEGSIFKKNFDTQLKIE